MKSRLAKLLFLLLLSGCYSFDDPAVNYQYKVPDSKPDGLESSSLAAEGIDEAGITTLTNLIVQDKYKRIDGVLLLKNNKLVYENYFHGHTSDILHNTFSASKSITSILVGIALDQGFIPSVQTPVYQLLPGYADFVNANALKKEITVEHLLTMNTGLDCNGWTTDVDNQMERSADWIQFTLNLPLIKNPGSQPSYCTGNAVTLGRIIEQGSGLSIEAFARKYLFEPLGITQYKWSVMPNGKISAGGQLFLKPRDMAKIGLLMLNNGVWQGKQIVSATWVQQSQKALVKLNSFDYGYLWWRGTFQVKNKSIPTYYASGNGGQHIFILPTLQMVAVFTGGNKNTSLTSQPQFMLRDYILPAIK